MRPDLLILTVYFICIFYVLYQMAKAVEDAIDPKVDIQLEAESLKESINQQLEQHQLDSVKAAIVPFSGGIKGLSLDFHSSDDSDEDRLLGSIKLQVAPQGEKPLQPIPGLTVEIINQMQYVQTAIDWDNSSLTLLTNQARRVIRHIPGMLISLGQPQVHTVVNPGQQVTAIITSEESFGRNPDNQVLQPVAPLLDLERIVNLPFKGAPGYSLMLLVSIYSMTGPRQPPIQLLVPFQFRIIELKDQPAFPVFRWLLGFSR